MDVESFWDNSWVSALSGYSSPCLTWYGQDRIELSGQVVIDYLSR